MAKFRQSGQVTSWGVKEVNSHHIHILVSLQDTSITSMQKLHGGGADGSPSLGEANNQVEGNLRGTNLSTVEETRI